MTHTREAALKQLCDGQWPAIDQQIAAALELPQWTASEPTRRSVFQKFRSDPRVSHYDPCKASDKHVLAEAFRQYALPMALVVARFIRREVPFLDPETLRSIRRRLRVKDLPKAPGKRPTRSEKRDARNLELLSFVIERIIPFGQLLRKLLNKQGRDCRLLPGHRGPKVAVPREALAEEWNRTHPGDTMSSGDVLVSQYYRVARRPHFARELLLQLQKEVDQQLDRLRNPRSWRKLRTLEEVQAYFASAKLQQPRDSRTRPELVRSALGRYGTWLWLGRADEQQWRTAIGNDVPLRHWFLEESQEYERQRQRDPDTASRPPSKGTDTRHARRDRTLRTVKLQPGMVALRCKARACNSASSMVVLCSSDGIEVHGERRCKGCKVAARLKTEGSAIARRSGSTKRG